MPFHHDAGMFRANVPRCPKKNTGDLGEYHKYLGARRLTCPCPTCDAGVPVVAGGWFRSRGQ
jgi:hypothetical protein